MVFYTDNSKKKANKVIDMGKVKTVSFHYDENAPVKSKNLDKKDKDESRFDLYTQQRVYMLKTDGVSIWDAQDWVRMLKAAGKRFNPDFGKN